MGIQQDNELIELVKGHTNYFPNPQHSTDKEHHGACPKCGGDDDSDRFWISNSKAYCRQCGEGFESVGGFYRFIGQENPNGSNGHSSNGHDRHVDLSRAPDDLLHRVTTAEVFSHTSSSKLRFDDMADYANRHLKIPVHVLESRGWYDCEWQGRAGFAIPSADGIPRFRGLDGKKPKYIPMKPHDHPDKAQAQWFDFPEFDQEFVVLCNGQTSVAVARLWGIEAFCFTDGEGAIPKHLLDDLLGAFAAFTDVTCVIALDGDKTGREATRKIIDQLPPTRIRIVEFGGDTGYDLADFCQRHLQNSLPQLLALSSPPNTAQVTSSHTSSSTLLDKIHNRERIPSIAEYPIIPFKSLHKFGGMCHALRPGKVAVIMGADGSGKTSFAESWVDAWARKGLDILWRGDEWTEEEYAQRRIQRYGQQFTTDAYAMAEIWKAEEALGVPPDKREGVPLTDEMVEEGERYLAGVQQWPGRIHYFPERTYIEDTHEEMLSLLAQLRREGRRVACAVFDYITLFESRDSERGNNAEAVLHSIKTFSIRSQLAAIGVAQVNKPAIDKNGGGRTDTWLTKGDLHYARSDKVNLLLGLNIIFSDQIDNTGKAHQVKTDKGRVGILKNSLGREWVDGRGHVMLNANLRHFIWQDR